MDEGEAGRIHAAEMVLPCTDLDATLRFFTESIGFRVEMIAPADGPSVAVIAGYGLRLRLDTHETGPAGTIRLRARWPDAIAGGNRLLTAPNGTLIRIVDADFPVVLPPLDPDLVLARMGDAEWGAGRAGMLYRDLIPGRLGGRFIASHILIRAGGPVPDYVHFHNVRCQMIFCRTGWVRLVYEDQGPPFVMEAVDCVLQPPRIRHRVLECSAGLEVVEIGCPALHETFADPDLPLPNPTIAPLRPFDGQRFQRHIAAKARWHAGDVPGSAFIDTGIAAATGGLAGVRVIRPGPATPPRPAVHPGELLFHFVLQGALELRCGGRHPLAAGDAFTIPAAMPYGFEACADALALLEVTMPAVATPDPPSA